MPNGYAKSESDIGHRFGKSDLERIGVFAEMDYMNGKGYVSPFSSEFMDMNSAKTLNLQFHYSKMTNCPINKISPLS
jgi:hypothetical protein